MQNQKIKNIKSVYTPSDSQVLKYRLYYIVTQVTILGLFALEANRQGFFSEWYNTDIAFAAWILGSMLIIIKNSYFFNAKNLYTIYLFDDSVFLDYCNDILFFSIKKTKYIKFIDLREIKYFSSRVVAGPFSHNRKGIYFKMISLSDFSFSTRGDSQIEKICIDIEHEFNLFKKNINSNAAENYISV